MKKFLTAIIHLCIIHFGMAQPYLPTGAIVFSDDFNNAQQSNNTWTALEGQYYNFSFVVQDSRSCVLTESNAPNSAGFISKRVYLQNVRGSKLVLSALIKAQNVSVPAIAYNGIKLMLKIYTSTNGLVSTDYSQVDGIGTGTFDWKNAGKIYSIPLNADSCDLYVGIQECVGKVWFDDVRLKVKRSIADYPPARDPNLAIQKYHSEPTLRGFMLGSVTQNDVQDMKQIWKVNVARWQLGDWNPNFNILDDVNNAQLNAALSKLDAAIPYFELYGIKLVLDLHTLSQKAVTSSAGQQKLVAVWKLLANKYKTKAIIWAYDLANEPEDVGSDIAWDDSLLLWEDLTEKIAKEIRLIDADKPIIIESIIGAPSNFEGLKPIDFAIPNIIYSTHFYEPLEFTHQGVAGNTTTASSYPGTINGQYWDKNALIKALKPVKDFQDKYRVPILIGEFSAVRWGPNNSAYNYLKDCIEIFESYKWDWIYHSFREYEGWSVEIGEDKNVTTPVQTPTQRGLLLLSYFNQNTVLPIELLDGPNAILKETSEVEINWATATEHETASFIVERSDDSKVFIPIGKIKAAGSSSSPLNYKIFDKNPSISKINYYRLKTINYDGTSELSHTVSIGIKAQSSYRISPNPAQGYVNIQSENDKDFDYQLFDATGQLVVKGHGRNSVKIGLDHLPNGFYTIHLMGSLHEFSVFPLIITR